MDPCGSEKRRSQLRARDGAPVPDTSEPRRDRTMSKEAESPKIASTSVSHSKKKKKKKKPKQDIVLKEVQFGPDMKPKDPEPASDEREKQSDDDKLLEDATAMTERTVSSPRIDESTKRRTKKKKKKAKGSLQPVEPTPLPPIQPLPMANAKNFKFVPFAFPNGFAQPPFDRKQPFGPPPLPPLGVPESPRMHVSSRRKKHKSSNKRPAIEVAPAPAVSLRPVLDDRPGSAPNIAPAKTKIEPPPVSIASTPTSTVKTDITEPAKTPPPPVSTVDAAPKPAPAPTPAPAPAAAPAVPTKSPAKVAEPADDNGYFNLAQMVEAAELEEKAKTKQPAGGTQAASGKKTEPENVAAFTKNAKDAKGETEKGVTLKTASKSSSKVDADPVLKGPLPENVTAFTKAARSKSVSKGDDDELQSARQTSMRTLEALSKRRRKL